MIGSDFNNLDGGLIMSVMVAAFAAGVAMTCIAVWIITWWF